ncbi:MAG: GLUG motif-containing protein [Planctomycetota bacterium]
MIAPNLDAGKHTYIGLLVGFLDNGIVTNCYVQGGSVSGHCFVGGLVGINSYGTISECYSTGIVYGNPCIGGLVGRNDHGTINKSYSTASVVGGEDGSGGLVGHNYYGTIINCYAAGSVSADDGIGGLVGSNWKATITNCYSIGSVSGDEDIGGLVGADREGSYTKSFWDKTVNSLLAGIGNAVNPDVIGEPTANMQTERTFTNAGWDFVNIWWILEGAGYPRFCWEDKYGGGSGRLNDPYLIYTPEQMNTIGVCKRDWDKHFKLMADIDLSGFTGTSFNIIGNRVSSSDNEPFNGVFDGNGHTISNFSYTTTDTDYIGLFGYVDDSNAVIKDLGLIAPNFDAGTGRRVGSLLGRLQKGTITSCYVEGGCVSGEGNVGGLVGFNRDGTITDSYSSCSVSGVNHVGGLTGSNVSTITNCYSTGSVSGTGWFVGGLVGVSSHSTITNCYATGTVLGDDFVGGLLGDNAGTITNCYSSGSVAGVDYVGGLLGRNSGEVIASFWDIETSGQTNSYGGVGLPTDQMQMQITFLDAGWDFVGETVNGIEDIWFIPQQDYPHLWWEEMQVPMKLTPRTLNCRSQGNWVKANLILPQGFTVADVDSNRPALLHSFGFESAPLYVFVNKDKLVQIEAAFERQAVCSLAGDWPQELTVAGFFADGSIFLGTSKVRIIHPGMKVIEDLTWYWLNADCVQPDFCNRIDTNRDSLVNLADYALLMNIEVEFVTDE